MRLLTLSACPAGGDRSARQPAPAGDRVVGRAAFSRRPERHRAVADPDRGAGIHPLGRGVLRGRHRVGAVVAAGGLPAFYLAGAARLVPAQEARGGGLERTAPQPRCAPTRWRSTRPCWPRSTTPLPPSPTAVHGPHRVAAVHPEPRRPMKWTLRFDDPLAIRPQFTGGKGANLARLWLRRLSGAAGVHRHRRRLPGLARSRPVVAGWRARPAARRLGRPRRGGGRDAPAAGRRAAAGKRGRRGPHRHRRLAGRNLFRGPFLVDHGGPRQAAFAGQHDTFLNCRGAEDVLAALRDCYLSLWHDRAIAYRHRHGFDHGAANMAVVVQQMADCDAAGVAFSIHPVTGDLTAAVVEANHGLGESVVNGGCEVDHWEIEKESGSACCPRRSPARPSAPSASRRAGWRNRRWLPLQRRGSRL